MLAGKKFSTNEEVIAETEAYFEAILKSYYKNGIAKNYMTAIIVASPSKASVLNDKLEFYQKNVLYYVSLRTFQPTQNQRNHTFFGFRYKGCSLFGVTHWEKYINKIELNVPK
jgi:hypothetical protein